MANPGFVEAYRTHEFVVEIEGVESPSITKVSGLTEGEIEAIEQPDGGAKINHKISSGIIKFGDLTLERHMDGTSDDKLFFDWFHDMFKLDGVGMGSMSRRNGSIVLKEQQQERIRFTFEGAWIKSSKFSELDAGTSGLMKQTIVLAVERMQRHDTPRRG